MMTPREPVDRDPRHWELRAEEAHVLAESLTDPVGRRIMTEVANQYSKMAARARELVALAEKRRQLRSSRGETDN